MADESANARVTGSATEPVDPGSDSVGMARRRASPSGLYDQSPPREQSNPFLQRTITVKSETMEDDGEFQIMQLRDSSEERDQQDNPNQQPLWETDEQLEETRLKIERRADLLAAALQAIITARKGALPHSQSYIGQSSSTITGGLCQNDPFRKKKSHNDLLQQEEASLVAAATGIAASEIHPLKQLTGIEEIRQVLIGQGTTSQSSHSGSMSVSYGHQHRISKPVVHESLYVYAADKEANGGLALAEKWRLTLVQTAGSNKQRKSVCRTSVLTGVNQLIGLLPDSPYTSTPSKSSAAAQQQENEEVVEVAGAAEAEESKEVDDMAAMPSVLVMEDDYFQTDEKDKTKSKIDTLTERTYRVAYQLPMHNLIVNQSVQAEWCLKKTKNWRPYASIQESEQIEVVVENVGKLLVQCEFITSSDIKAHILADKREQAEITEAGLRHDSIRSGRKSSIFQALSGAFTSSPTAAVQPAQGRPRFQSDHTPYLATFGQGLTSKPQNKQLTLSTGPKDLQPRGAATHSNSDQSQQVQQKLKLNLMSALGAAPQNDSNNAVVSQPPETGHKLSGESQTSSGKGIFGRIAGTLGSIIDSARGVNSRRGSTNFVESGVMASSTAIVDSSLEPKPQIKSRTLSGNPFAATANHQNNQSSQSSQNQQLPKNGRPRMSDLIGMALSGENVQAQEHIESGRQRVSSLRENLPKGLISSKSQTIEEPVVQRTRSYAENVAKALHQIDSSGKVHEQALGSSSLKASGGQQTSSSNKAAAADNIRFSQALCMSVSQSMSRGDLQLMTEDGTVIEINSQSSVGTTPEDSPLKLKSQDLDDEDAKNSTENDISPSKDDFEDNFGYLLFDGKELANSFEAAAKEQSKVASRATSQQQPLAPLSTRSENEEERAQRFQLQLRQLRVMTQEQLKSQEAAMKTQQEASFVSLSQDQQKERQACRIKAEFVNLLKVRKVIDKSIYRDKDAAQ